MKYGPPIDPFGWLLGAAHAVLRATDARLRGLGPLRFASVWGELSDLYSVINVLKEREVLHAWIVFAPVRAGRRPVACGPTEIGAWAMAVVKTNMERIDMEQAGFRCALATAVTI